MKKMLILCMLFNLITISYGQTTKPNSKFRIYCTDVNKRSQKTHAILSEHEEDFITITIYSNNILIESATFGWTLNYSGNWKYEEEHLIWKTEKGEQYKTISNHYICDQKHIAYARPNEEKMVKPLMQIQPNNGYYYNFNVVYGELYDFKTNKWIYGAATLAPKKELDKVYMKLRSAIGRHFCSNFISDLADDLSFGDDPWDIDR